jgi:SAM-dependent methyltransferase
MDQEKIWDYFQNSDLADVVFPEVRQRYLLRLLESGQRVLNIGVGSGDLERLGGGKGVEMYALDPSDKAIERLRKNLAMGDRAQSGYAQNIPFQDNFFDVVVMSEVLEHLSDDVLIRAAKEVFRVLKIGGRFVATTPYREDLRLGQVVCPHCGDIFHKVGHVQSFDKERMGNLLIGCGFKIERMWLDTFVDWRRGGLKNFIKSIVRKSLAKIGEGIADPHLIVIARKT